MLVSFNPQISYKRNNVCNKQSFKGNTLYSAEELARDAFKMETLSNVLGAKPALLKDETYIELIRRTRELVDRMNPRETKEINLDLEVIEKAMGFKK